MAALGKRLAKLEAQVSQLLAMVTERDAEIVRLKARVAELEAQLGQNSTNSGKPPSTDPPGTRASKPATGRKPGGQPGHEGHKRVLLPPEMVTARTVLRPKLCACCGGRRLEAGEGVRAHQVVDVPAIRPDVHQYDMHEATCLDCGKSSWAKLPSDVGPSMFGPRLLGLVGYLLAARMSRRQVQEMLRETFGIPVSLGALSQAEERISDAIAGPVEAAAAYVRGQPVKHVDGTTWRIAGSYAALWTIATRLVVTFFVLADAKADTIAGILGTLKGIMVSDRGSQFGFWAMKRRQICWAHLIRKFVAFTDRKDEGAKLGEGLLLLAQTVLHAWHQVRDGTRTRKSFQNMTCNAQVAFEALLERGVSLRLRGVSGSCRDILAHREALFTFAHQPGVDPTNNHAERMLRPFVQWRKTSYGSQSERGWLFAQRIMTVSQSLRLQGRSVFEFLMTACHVAQSGERRRP